MTAAAKVDLAVQAMTFFTASNGWQVAIHEGPYGPYLLGGSPDGVLARDPNVNLQDWQIRLLEDLIPGFEDARAREWVAAMCEFHRHLSSGVV